MLPITQATANKTSEAVLNQVAERQASNKGLGRVSGKVGVITGVGPAAGIGAQSARVFAREGAKAIYLVDVSPDIQTFAAELQKTFPDVKVSHVVGDAASRDVIKGVVDKALQENGRFDFFFSNAGVSMIRPKDAPPRNADPRADFAISRRGIADVSEEEWSEVMRINALSVYIALKYAPPAMAQLGGGKQVPGGTIVATASVAGLRANAGPIAYSASKAAIVNMVQNGAYVLAGQNIRVNAICPGLIKTDMTGLIFKAVELGAQKDTISSVVPSLRHGLPEDIASAALWLSTDESSYINGQAIAVDGALTSSIPYDPSRRAWKQE